jgi:hypothetical protein
MSVPLPRKKYRANDDKKMAQLRTEIFFNGEKSDGPLDSKVLTSVHQFANGELS